MGKLIVIEGLDGCGKSTQLEMLFKRMQKEGIPSKEVSFPNYDSKACEPVKMYLAGEFGSDINSVNAYAASVFYAVDRYASFKTDWGKNYNENDVILCGRYVTSNNIHQCSKLDESEWETFSDWLSDFEYNKMGLPKPDCVIFLSMPTEYSDKLLSKRYEGDESKRDIHELDKEYQLKCRNAALFSAEHGGWHIVNCVKDDSIRSIEDISNEIFSIVSHVIKGE